MKKKTCPECGGDGREIDWAVSPDLTRPFWVYCPACRGRGRVSLLFWLTWKLAQWRAGYGWR